MTREDFFKQSMKAAFAKPGIESWYRKVVRQFSHIKNMPYGLDRTGRLNVLMADIEHIKKDYEHLVPLAFPDSDSKKFYDFYGVEIPPEYINDYSTSESDYHFYLELAALNTAIKQEIEDGDIADMPKVGEHGLRHIILSGNSKVINFITQNYASQKGKSVAILYLALKELNLLSTSNKADFYRAFLHDCNKTDEVDRFRKGVDDFLRNTDVSLGYITNKLKQSDIQGTVDRLKSFM